MNTKLNLICVYDTSENKFIGYFESMKHIVAYGSTMPELVKELFKSISIVADYSVRQNPDMERNNDGVITKEISLMAMA